jgi:hypothetical protein
MLTILDINRALDRLGSVAFASRKRTSRAAASPPATSEPATIGSPGAMELQPDIVLPEQLDDLGCRSRIPEHRLMLAVLEDAVAVYQAGCLSQLLAGRPLFRDTEAWFASDDTASPFSFVTICELFAIDPAYFRSGLGRWRAWHADRTADGRRASFAFRRVSGIRHRLTGPRLRRRA